jgi:hypothetical protein
MTSEQQKQMEDDVEQAVEQAVQEVQETVKTFPARHHTATLSTQWETLARYERELRDRVRRERLAIVADFERLATETKGDFDRRIDDAVVQLEVQRNTALRVLRDQMEARLREHDLLSQRMG